MPAVLTAPPPPTIAPSLVPLPKLSHDTFDQRKRWTADECAKIEQLGLLPERYELLDGDIVEKMGQNLPHAYGISGLTYYFYQFLTIKEVVQQTTVITAPEDAPRNRPQPDIAILTPAKANDSGPDALSLPVSTDLRFVAEVSDATLADDLGYKAGLYARANIPGYWVLDVNARRVVVHLLPVNGRYTSIAEYDANSRIAPAFAPNQSALVGDLL